MFDWFRRKRRLTASPGSGPADSSAEGAQLGQIAGKAQVSPPSHHILLKNLPAAERRLAEKILADASSGAIKIPSLPDLALAIRRAVNDPDVSVEQVVKLVQADLVTGSKLVQVANSAIYGGYTRTETILQAVTRLGLYQTRDIVTGLTIRNLFRSDRADIEVRMRMLWRQSVKVAAISAVLARITQKLDPERALLAGLTHEIGGLAVLTYIALEPEDAYREVEINAAVKCLRGLVGNIVLNHWKFENGLAQVPLGVSDMSEHIPGGLTYADIVRVAKLNAVAGTPDEQDFPPSSEVTSFRKIADIVSGPEVLIDALHGARADIDAIKKTLGV